MNFRTVLIQVGRQGMVSVRAGNGVVSVPHRNYLSNSF